MHIIRGLNHILRIVVLLLIVFAAYKFGGNKSTQASTPNNLQESTPNNLQESTPNNLQESITETTKASTKGRWLFPYEQPGGCHCHSGLYPANHPEIPDTSTMRKPIWIEQEMTTISWQ